MNAAEPFPGGSRGATVERIFGYSRWDALLVALALAHGFILLATPRLWVIAVGVWWSSNTVAHNFIHLPFFRQRHLNQLFSAYLSALLGIPQALWRQRHLAHHANIPWRLQMTWPLCLESLIVAVVWISIYLVSPRFFLAIYLPGYLLGLGLCWLQGHYEHASGTTSHYGSLYNYFFFNDGYHVEHHAHPGVHWRALPRKGRFARGSRWPAALRWLDAPVLNSLERLVLRSTRLQQFVLSKHERAFRQLLSALPGVRSVGIVGGAIFPRTALILQRLLPEAQLTIIDAGAENIRQAVRFLGKEVRFEHAWFDVARAGDFDLVVIPLSFIGNRELLYRHPPAGALLIHDWLWRIWPTSAHISVALMKRLNLVLRDDPRFPRS